MATKLALLAVLALASLVSAQEPNQCGFWLSSCNAIPNDPNDRYAFGQMLVDGISDGKFTWMREVYPNTPDQCSPAANPDLVVAFAGQWTDLGDAAIQNLPTARFWQLLSDSVDVTPGTQAVADLLNAGCPCGGQWTPKSTRTLTYCDPETCPDTTWMGGYAGDGIVFGQPMFGYTSLSNGVISVSQLSADFNIAFYSLTDQNIFGTFTQNTTCDPPTSDVDFCGTWNQPCSPTFAVNAQSYNSIFMYDGPTADLYESGIFTYEASYYEDAACTNLHLSVIVGGTFMQKGQSTVVTGGYKAEWNAPAVQVTPLTDIATAELKADCPCGDATQWKTGITRTLTTCIDTCNAYWYWNTTVGNPLYGNYRRQERDGDVELRFSPLSSDGPTGYNTPLKVDSFAYAFNDGSCNYPHESEIDFCGVWEKKCFAGEGDEDVDLTIAFTGSGNNGSIGTGEGLFDRFRATFTPGTNCDPSQIKMSITETGFWSDMGPSNTVDGARNVLINIPSVEVVVADPSTIKLLNDPKLGCPCGGTWVQNIPRTLTACPIGSCPHTEWIDGSIKPLGVPGYGIMRAQEETLRISLLAADMTSGFAQPLDLDALPIQRAEACNPDTPSYTYCGTYTQPCRADASTNLDTSSELTITKKGGYTWVRSLFQTGYGCENNAALLMEQKGTIEVFETSKSVIYGMQIEFKPSVIKVTPVTADMVQQLTTACPCSKTGSIWVLDKTVNLECPPNTCPDYSLFHQPPGPSAFGSIQRIGEFVRITDLGSNKNVSFNLPLSPHDFALLLTDSGACKSHSGASGMHGGDVFLLIFFFTAIIYFAGGMVLNYRESGVPTIPHVGFWTTIPGLISEGINFSLCQCCGLRGTPGYGYSSARLNKDDSSGYGAL